MNHEMFSLVLDFERRLRAHNKPPSWAKILVADSCGEGDEYNKHKLDELERRLKRIIDGEHIAHILGYAYFLGRPFKVSSKVLIPRFDTEVIVQAVCATGAQSIVDWCTGSGCIGISVALDNPSARVLLLDISKQACQIAACNIQTHGVGQRVAVINADCRSTWPVTSVDCIVANPPYIPSGDPHMLDLIGQEPVLALDGGVDGMDFVNLFIRQATAYLNKGGYLVLECGYDQQEVVNAAVDKNIWSSSENLYDLSGRFRGIKLRRV